MLIAFCLCLLPALASAQAVVKNPTRVVFKPGSDAALVTGYEIDIINAQGSVVQTLTFPAQAADTNGDVTIAFNVQPIAFGKYTVAVRNVYMAILSVTSDQSDQWERAPGQPGKPKAQ
jgi:hypothetical protein